MKLRFFIVGFLLLLIGLLSDCGSFTRSTDDRTAKTISLLSPQKRELLRSNLKVAFDAEYRASIFYVASAQAAQKSNDTLVSRFFFALAFADGMHSNCHKKLLEKLGVDFVTPSPLPIVVGTIEQNLRQAIQIETNKTDKIYLPLSDQVKDIEEFKLLNGWISKTETNHVMLIEALLAGDGETGLTQPTVFYVCPRCGEMYTNQNVGMICSICSTKEGSFLEF